MSATLAATAELAWGYTMAEVERIAWRVVRQHTHSAGLDQNDRYECAWHAVIEGLYSAEEFPHHSTLMREAFAALTREQYAWERGRGMKNGQPMANFSRYWLPVGRIRGLREDGFSDHLCEVMSLRQALEQLSPLEYDTLVTLAAFDGESKAAAAALNMTYASFRGYLHRGQWKVKAAFFGDETPPKRRSASARASKNTCGRGHSRAEHGWQRESDGAWLCRICKRNTNRASRARSRS